MTVVAGLLETGWIAAIAVVVLWTEIALVARFSARPSARFRALLANALSGTFLLIAVGLALAGDHLIAVAACLALSLAAHAVDMLGRLSVTGRD